MHARLLIRAERGLQLRRGRFPSLLGRTQFAQHGSELLSGRDADPLFDIFRHRGRRVPGQIGPGQQPHPLKKRDAAVSRLALHLLPVLQGHGQLPAVQLDPLAFQRNQTAGRGQNALHLPLAERLPVERYIHRKIEQRANPKFRRRVSANLDVDHRSRRFRGLPPVRHTDNQSAGFQVGNALQKAIGVPSVPSPRGVQASG